MIWWNRVYEHSTGKGRDRPAPTLAPYPLYPWKRGRENDNPLPPVLVLEVLEAPLRDALQRRGVDALSVDVDVQVVGAV